MAHTNARTRSTISVTYLSPPSPNLSWLALELTGHSFLERAIDAADPNGIWAERC